MDWVVHKEIFSILLLMICWRESLAWILRSHGRCLEVQQHHYLFTPTSHPRVFPVRLFATQYTIEEEGVDPEVLEKTVHKHFENLDRFSESKPVATHTQEAFSTLESMLMEIGRDARVILDSGCGTGKSTITLGQLYPNHIIVGVDRSLARLTRNGIYREQDSRNGGIDSNVVFVRADLVDLWRLWTSSTLPKPEQHYLLYPNPYPKKRRFQSRWYAHPALPLILQELESDKIVVRSNWKAYVDDFASAAATANKLQLEKAGDITYSCQLPTVLDPTQPGWTNFEQKYFDCGEECYEVILTKSETKPTTS